MPVEAETLPQSSEANSRAITWRSVGIGAVAVALLCAIAPYNDFVVANTFLVGSYLPLALVLTIFLLVILVNAPLRAMNHQGLSSGELSIVLLMLLVGSSIPGQGLLRTLLPSMVAPFYFGQSNPPFWEAFSKLDLPAWLFPVESIKDGRTSDVAQQFYGRTPPGQAMPLSAWVIPLLGWGVFVGGMMLTLVSLAFLFRVQWAQNERLAFPLAQLQLALIEPPPPGRALNQLFRSKLFWIAAGAVLIVHSLTALNQYFPRHVTTIPLSYDFTGILSDEPWTKLPWDIKRATIFFTFVGVTYFIQSRIAFSLWFIYVLTQFITMYIRMRGQEFLPPAKLDQHFSACVVYVLGMLWLARKYLWGILRSFTAKDASLRDSRYAMVGTLVGIVVMIAWLIVVGASVPMTLLIVTVILLAHLAVSRIVAETGLPIIRTMPTLQQVFINVPAKLMSGKDVFFAGHASMTAVAANRESLMCYTQHGLRVVDGASESPRPLGRLAAVIALAILIGVVTASFSSLASYYSYSGILASGEPTIENKHGMETSPEENIVKPLAAWRDGKFTPPAHTPWVHLSLGAVITGALQLLTWRFAWWPFVPVGFIASQTVFMPQIWFSIFIGWLIKVIVLRFGGATLYKTLGSLFIGLIFGEALASAGWLVVNMILASAGMDYVPVRFLPS